MLYARISCKIEPAVSQELVTCVHDPVEVTLKSEEFTVILEPDPELVELVEETVFISAEYIVLYAEVVPLAIPTKIQLP